MKHQRVLRGREGVSAADQQGWKSRPQAAGNLLKIGPKQTGVPKANPSITRGTWTSITPRSFLCLRLLESSGSLGNQSLF